MLTLNEKGQMKVNFLLTPSYQDAQEMAFTYKLNQLPYSIDWSQNKNKQILKAVFIQFPNAKNEFVMYLVVQLKSKVMSFNLGNGQSRTYETNSTVPFLQHHPDPTSDAHIAL